MSLTLSKSQGYGVVLGINVREDGLVVGLDDRQQLEAQTGPPQGKVVPSVVGLSVRCIIAVEFIIHTVNSGWYQGHYFLISRSQSEDLL